MRARDAMDMETVVRDHSTHLRSQMEDPVASATPTPAKAAEDGDHRQTDWWRNLPEDLPERVIFVRDQVKGLGDVIMSLAAVQGVRKLAREAEIVYQTSRGFHPVLSHHPDIDVVLELDDETPDGHVIDISRCCAEYEHGCLSATGGVAINRTHVFLQRAGVPDGVVEPPRVRFTHEQHARGSEILGESEMPTVGICLRSAERWRDYPWNRELALLLQKRGYRVAAIDQRSELSVPGVVQIVKVSLPDLIGVTANLDAVITPDTALFHLGAALGVPVVGMFGPTDGWVRGRGYPDSQVRIVQRSNCPSQPCWYTRCRGLNEIQPCMKQMHPRRVVGALMEMVPPDK
jgi:ADP-heptose:LPS heptosyltransferase